MNPLVPLVDVRLGEELFAEAGVAPEKEDEGDAHDEEDADDDQRDQERRVSLLVVQHTVSVAHQERDLTFTIPQLGTSLG